MRRGKPGRATNWLQPDMTTDCKGIHIDIRGLLLRSTLFVHCALSVINHVTSSIYDVRARHRVLERTNRKRQHSMAKKVKASAAAAAKHAETKDKKKKKKKQETSSSSEVRFIPRVCGRERKIS